MKQRQIEQDAVSTMKNMLNCVPEPDPKMENLPKSFCASNREQDVYWYPDICSSLQALTTTIISKFRRRKRKSYRWDLKISTLKQWLVELRGIIDDEEIGDLELKVME